MPAHVHETPPQQSRNSSQHALETLSYEDPQLYEKLRILDEKNQDELSKYDS